MAPPFFDTHCHLQDERFTLQVRDVLERARRQGLSHFACCGCREEDWDSVRALSRQHPDVIPLLGLHPWYVAEAGPHWLSRLERLLVEERAGVGECGLDFAIENADRPRQEQAFRQQLSLARRLNHPVSIHCRKAWESLIAITRDVGLPPCGAVVHSYSGSAEVARQLQALGFYLSFSCSLANPENRRSAKALLAVTDERLLFETDAPDIPPRGVPGFGGTQINEPSNIHLVAEAAAALRGVEVAELAHRVHNNALRVFAGILPTPGPSEAPCA